MKDEKHGVKPEAAVRPLFITKPNSQPTTGQQFRFWKSNFPHLVRRVGRRDVIVAVELERAVQAGSRRAFEFARPEADVGLDAAETVRGLLRRAGSR